MYGMAFNAFYRGYCTDLWHIHFTKLILFSKYCSIVQVCKIFWIVYITLTGTLVAKNNNNPYLYTETNTILKDFCHTHSRQQSLIENTSPLEHRLQADVFVFLFL